MTFSGGKLDCPRENRARLQCGRKSETTEQQTVPYLIPMPSRTLLHAIHILRLPRHLQHVTHRKPPSQPDCCSSSCGAAMAAFHHQWRWQQQLTVNGKGLVGHKYRKGVCNIFEGWGGLGPPSGQRFHYRITVVHHKIFFPHASAALCAACSPLQLLCCDAAAYCSGFVVMLLHFKGGGLQHCCH